MTTVADIFDKLQPGDTEIMWKAWVFSPLTSHLDLALIPFVEAHRMHRLLHHYGKLAQDVNKRPPERIRKKLKRAIIRTYPRKGCTCAFCSNEFIFEDDLSQIPVPMTWQSPTRTYRFGESAIRGVRTSFVILDDIVQGATLKIEDFNKAFRDLMDRVEKGEKC